MLEYYRATDRVLPVARLFGGVWGGAFWDWQRGGGGERGGDGGCGGLLEWGRGAGKHIGPTWNQAEFKYVTKTKSPQVENEEYISHIVYHHHPVWGSYGLLSSRRCFRLSRRAAGWPTRLLQARHIWLRLDPHDPFLTERILMLKETGLQMHLNIKNSFNVLAISIMKVGE